MTTQYGPTVDKRLNAIGRQIEDAETKIAEATTEKNEAWNEVDAIRGEVAKGKPFRFIADNGHTYAYQLREGRATFDPQKFEALLFQTYEPAQAKKIWNTITKRILDTAMMEAAVRVKKIPQELVDQCMTVAPDTEARVHPEWTKADAERARILGIEKLP